VAEWSETAGYRSVKVYR